MVGISAGFRVPGSEFRVQSTTFRLLLVIVDKLSPNSEPGTPNSKLRTRNRYLGGDFGFEFLRFVIGAQRVDQVPDLAFHEKVQLVRRVANPMIAHAVVFEVVGPDL